LAAIKETRGIRELFVSGNEIDKKGAQLLAECVSSSIVNLRKLAVSRCGLSKGAMLLLGQALMQSISLKELDVSGNELKDSEAAAAWGEALKTSKTIDYLSLDSCGISADAFTIIAAGIGKNKSLTHLNLSNNPKLGKGSFPAVSIFHLHFSSAR
jgi:Ran GTPase-activating protein (RanGAP) involved in mRNA processing and transport